MASGIPEVWERFRSVGEAQSACGDLRRGGGSHASVWPSVVTGCGCLLSAWYQAVCSLRSGRGCCCNLTLSCPFFALSSKAGLSQGCNHRLVQYFSYYISVLYPREGTQLLRAQLSQLICEAAHSGQLHLSGQWYVRVRVHACARLLHKHKLREHFLRVEVWRVLYLVLWRLECKRLCDRGQVT